MKKHILAVAVTTSILAVGSAFADAPNVAGTFFINPSFGGYITQDSRNLNNGGVETLAGGYNFNQYFAAQVAASLLNLNDTGYFIRAEGLFNIPTGTALVPYLALGAGALKVTQGSFAPDAGAGLKYYISNNLALGVDYRYVVQVTGGTWHDNMFGFGVTWTFGGVGANLGNGAQQPAAQYQPQQLNAQQQQAVAQASQTLKNVLPQGVEQCGVNGATPQTGCITLSGNQVTMHLDVKFQQNMAKIQGQFAPAITRLATFMNTYPTTYATLYGYASSEGPLAFNQKLSLKRANQVKNYLVTQQNIDASRITTVGMGIQNPIATNATDAGRQQNRRVEAAVAVPLKGQQQ